MQVTDFHNHLMPAVDDGAQTREESAAALAVMAAEGVGAIITTPHVNASITGNPELLSTRLAELDTGWAALQEVATGGRVQLFRGAEVALDTPHPDLSCQSLRLAGTAFVLVEFAYMRIPPNSTGVFRNIRAAGWIPVLAHPERYVEMPTALETAMAWRQAGALLQLNGASLLGRYGPDAKRSAQRLLARGWIDYISSDFHSRSGPWIARYREWLAEHGGGEQAALLMEINPGRLLQGELPLPVPPLRPQRGVWNRMRSIFR
jgi:protein-tyrosine phosphatase